MTSPSVTTPPVFRFAPSPNGELHLGHALSALAAYDAAQKARGRFLLRIEDIDVTRCREEYVEQIFEDLRWLGLAWEMPLLRQSQHFDVYAKAASWLENIGLLYPCFATRTEIAEAAARQPSGFDPDGAPLYPGLHKKMAGAEAWARRQRSEPFALRLDMDRALAAAAGLLNGAALTFTEFDEAGEGTIVAARPERWVDAIIVRKDVPASYHLAVTIDDARQGVTHVTRGMDLFAATDLHRLLQVLLGLPEPKYRHHRLITDAEGRKLAKSAHDTSIRSLREAGLSPSDIRALVQRI
ncbi:MAG: tRNA glutamyl-Q(34) synthetase GluQRS [Hyphomicrobium sp.]|jgi:glutamyl-Q tRNA(Asp) synthetase